MPSGWLPKSGGGPRSPSAERTWTRSQSRLASQSPRPPLPIHRRPSAAGQRVGDAAAVTNLTDHRTWFAPYGDRALRRRRDGGCWCRSRLRPVPVRPPDRGASPARAAWSATKRRTSPMPPDRKLRTRAASSGGLDSGCGVHRGERVGARVVRARVASPHAHERGDGSRRASSITHASSVAVSYGQRSQKEGSAKAKFNNASWRWHSASSAGLRPGQTGSPIPRTRRLRSGVRVEEILPGRDDPGRVGPHFGHVGEVDRVLTTRQLASQGVDLPCLDHDEYRVFGGHVRP